jgi:hypothetical protein
MLTIDYTNSKKFNFNQVRQTIGWVHLFPSHGMQSSEFSRNKDSMVSVLGTSQFWVFLTYS